LTADGFQDTKSFTIKMDPNLKGITEKDLQEQFDLAMRIRDKTTAANEAVIKIRDIRKKLNSQLEKASDEGLKKSAGAMLEKMTAVEEELYQVKNQSNQDPLNFPIKLNNRLASLLRVVNVGDGRPIASAEPIFIDLTAEL